jgi:hypothetical protein
MLTDPKEIEIISRARQANVRDPRRSRKHFEVIYEDFLRDVSWPGRVVLDIGPGQYDLGEILRPRGALVEGVDNDPAVLELGRYKGYRVLEGNLRQLAQIDFGRCYDGLFCKLSLNVFWSRSPQAAQEDVGRLLALAQPDAWLWIAPWNGVPKDMDARAPEVAQMLGAQRRAFQDAGCEVYELPEALTHRYGIHGLTANWPVITRGVKIPPSLQPYRAPAAP